MGNLNQKGRIRHAVLHAPQLIPLYFEKPYNKQITKSVLNKMVGRRVGIEIECFGSLMASSIIHKKNRRGEDRIYSLEETDIIELYGIHAYKEDNWYGQCEESEFYITKPDLMDNNGFNEHKISIINWSQLEGLYNILEEMKSVCRLNEGSGIHIHLDLHPEFSIVKDPYEITKIFKRHLDIDVVEKIFYPNSKYTPSYNTDRQVGFGKGNNWIGIRDAYQSIEFRLAPMSFEYSEIVRWIVECTKLVDAICDKYIHSKVKAKPTISNRMFFKEEMKRINSIPNITQDTIDKMRREYSRKENIARRTKIKIMKYLERRFRDEEMFRGLYRIERLCEIEESSIVGVVGRIQL